MVLLMFSILLIFLLLLVPVQAIRLTESIVLGCDGELDSYTDIGKARDQMHGIGEQNYNRSFEYNSIKCWLSSKYRFNGSSPDELSSYLIGMTGEDGNLKHVVWASDSKNFNSSSTINVVKGGGIEAVKTDYNISGVGKLRERITTSTICGHHPKDIAGTWLNGSYRLNSGLVDNMSYYSEDIEILYGKVVVNDTDKSNITGMVIISVGGNNTTSAAETPISISNLTDSSDPCDKFKGVDDKKWYECQQLKG